MREDNQDKIINVISKKLPELMRFKLSKNDVMSLLQCYGESKHLSKIDLSIVAL